MSENDHDRKILAAGTSPQPLNHPGEGSALRVCSKRSPAETSVAPDLSLPCDEELLTAVRGQPGISLRELCAIIWPALPWLPAEPAGDSATEWPRHMPDAAGALQLTTAGVWLRDRMRGLMARGLVRLGDFRRRDPLLAGLTYFVPGTVPIINGLGVQHA